MKSFLKLLIPFSLLLLAACTSLAPPSNVANLPLPTWPNQITWELIDEKFCIDTKEASDLYIFLKQYKEYEEVIKRLNNIN